MADIYQRAIDRLKKRRKQSPYAQIAKQETGTLSTEFTDLKRGLETSMRGSTSPLAKMQATQEAGKQYQSVIGGVYDQMNAQDRQRIMQINQQIDELEFKRDIAEEEKQRQKKALEDQKKKMLWQIGGAVAGAGITALSGGTALPALMAGAKIGAGIGQVAGAGVGDFNVEEAYSGLFDIAGGISDVATLKIESDLGTGMDAFLKATKDLSSTEKTRLYETMLQYKSDPKQLLQFYNNWRTYLPTSQQTTMMPTLL